MNMRDGVRSIPGRGSVGLWRLWGQEADRVDESGSRTDAGADTAARMLWGLMMRALFVSVRRSVPLDQRRSNGGAARPRAWLALWVSALLWLAPGALAQDAYVTNLQSDDVSAVDTQTNTVTTTFGVGDGPTDVAITPDGARAYVTNGDSHSVSVIDTQTNTVTTTITAGDNPVGVAITPDGSRAYVTNTVSDNVSVIDTQTNTVTTTFGVGDGPFGVAIVPTPESEPEPEPEPACLIDLDLPLLELTLPADGDCLLRL